MVAMKPIGRSSRLLIALLTVPVLAVGLTGCGLFESTASDEEAFEGVTEIRLDAGNATFTITGGDVAEATVRRELQYRWRDPEDSTAIDDGVLTLRGCGRNCSVDYTVEVPEGTPVSGRTSNGTIDLTGLGAVDVASSNGRVDVTESGPVVVETSNGGIAVDLRETTDVTARTSNGAIEVAVPDGSYRVATETSNGTIEMGVDQSTDAEHLLQLHTSNGDVSVVGRGTVG